MTVTGGWQQVATVLDLLAAGGVPDHTAVRWAAPALSIPIAATATRLAEIARNTLP